MKREMRKVWYCIISYYPGGLPKVEYMTNLRDWKKVEAAHKSGKGNENPCEILCIFKLIDEWGNLLRHGENLTSIFRSLKVTGYPDANLILRLDPDPRYSFQKEISVRNWFCGTIIFSDGTKEIYSTWNTWEKVLFNLLMSSSDKK